MNQPLVNDYFLLKVYWDILTFVSLRLIFYLRFFSSFSFIFVKMQIFINSDSTFKDVFVLKLNSFIVDFKY